MTLQKRVSWDGRLDPLQVKHGIDHGYFAGSICFLVFVIARIVWLAVQSIKLIHDPLSLTIIDLSHVLFLLLSFHISGLSGHQNPLTSTRYLFQSG
jgi:hypothetical protein